MITRFGHFLHIYFKYRYKLKLLILLVSFIDFFIEKISKLENQISSQNCIFAQFSFCILLGKIEIIIKLAKLLIVPAASGAVLLSLVLYLNQYLLSLILYIPSSGENHLMLPFV